SDGERGVLAYLAARVLSASGADGWRVAGVVTSPAAMGEVLGPGPRLRWEATVCAGGTAGTARLWLPLGSLDALDPRPEARWGRVAHLRVPLAVEAGAAMLPGADLRGLEPGAVIVLDEAWLRPGDDERRVRVRLAGARRTRWWCTATGAELRLQSIDHSTEAASARGRAMTNDETTATIMDRAGDAPVEVTVELARFTMALEELAAVQPGEVLVTGRAVGERVVLRAGDRAIGVGELVDVDGEVGVRVLRLE
ncbi:MAG: type III secretion system cytoplasmic ring protein SctQ, partial [Myxococcota bacterium]